MKTFFISLVLFAFPSTWASENSNEAKSSIVVPIENHKYEIEYDTTTINGSQVVRYSPILLFIENPFQYGPYFVIKRAAINGKSKAQLDIYVLLAGSQLERKLREVFPDQKIKLESRTIQSLQMKLKIPQSNSWLESTQASIASNGVFQTIARLHFEAEKNQLSQIIQGLHFKDMEAVFKVTFHDETDVSHYNRSTQGDCVPVSLATQELLSEFKNTDAIKKKPLFAISLFGGDFLLVGKNRERISLERKNGQEVFQLRLLPGERLSSYQERSDPLTLDLVIQDDQIKTHSLFSINPTNGKLFFQKITADQSAVEVTVQPWFITAQKMWGSSPPVWFFPTSRNAQFRRAWISRDESRIWVDDGSMKIRELSPNKTGN